MTREVTVFEKSREGRGAYSLPECDVPRVDAASVIPPGLLRHDPPRLPEISEPELMSLFAGNPNLFKKTLSAHASNSGVGFDLFRC